MIINDDGYEWHEVTNLEDKAHGRRVFVRGKPKDEAARLRDELEALAEHLQKTSPDAAEMIRKALR